MVKSYVSLLSSMVLKRALGTATAQEELKDEDNEKNISELIILGISMGIVHILTGPDHLSALATLSANVGNCEAVGLGMRWGVGHSTGLILVAAILIAISEGGDVEESSVLAHSMEFIVGVFMIILGSYGVYRVYYKHSMGHSVEAADENHNVYHNYDLFEQDVSFDVPTASSTDASASTYINIKPELNTNLHHTDANPNKNSDIKGKEGGQDGILAEISDRDGDITQTYSFPNDDDRENTSVKESSDLNKSWAFVIGVVHGFAGPGGVLGVLPAVQLHNVLLASIYLGTFCITSILVMGMFAGLYGSCTHCLSKTFDIQFYLQLCSALLCLAVGILWCVLILAGKMHFVFPE